MKMRGFMLASQVAERYGFGRDSERGCMNDQRTPERAWLHALCCILVGGLVAACSPKPANSDRSTAASTHARNETNAAKPNDVKTEPQMPARPLAELEEFCGHMPGSLPKIMPALRVKEVTTGCLPFVKNPACRAALELPPNVSPLDACVPAYCSVFAADKPALCSSWPLSQAKHRESALRRALPAFARAMLNHDHGGRYRQAAGGVALLLSRHTLND